MKTVNNHTLATNFIVGGEWINALYNLVVYSWGQVKFVCMDNFKGAFIENITNERCELVSGEDVSFLEGRIKTLIESFGLNEKQEKSAKDMAQMVLWDWFNFITNHTTDHLKVKTEWYKTHNPLE